MTKISLFFALFYCSFLFGQEQEVVPKRKFGFGLKQNQTKIKPQSFWMEWDTGVGASTVQMDPFSRIYIGTTLSANWIDSQYKMFSIRGGYHRDQGLMDGFMGRAGFQQEMGELGFQVGGTFAGKYFRTSLLFGLSSIFGIGLGEEYGSSGSTWSGGPKGYMKNRFLSVGVPLTIKTAFCPGKFGFGVALDANLNPYMSYLSLKLNLIFGDIHK